MEEVGGVWRRWEGCGGGGKGVEEMGGVWRRWEGCGGGGKERYSTCVGGEVDDTTACPIFPPQSRAPSSPVIIVGTHVDKLPPSSAKDLKDHYSAMIRAVYEKNGFPSLS